MGYEVIVPLAFTSRVRAAPGQGGGPCGAMPDDDRPGLDDHGRGHGRDERGAQRCHRPARTTRDRPMRMRALRPAIDYAPVQRAGVS